MSSSWTSVYTKALNLIGLHKLGIPCAVDLPAPENTYSEEDILAVNEAAVARFTFKKWNSCTVFVTSYRNARGSLGERKVLWGVFELSQTFTSASITR